MIRNIGVVGLLLLMVLTACQPAGSGSLTAKDKAAIEADAQNWMEAANAADWESLAEKYSENAIFMPPNQPAVEGRANILAWFESFPPINTINLKPVEVDGVGNLAYVRGTYTVTFTPEDAEPVTDSGKYMKSTASKKMAHG
jgi:ketosteroid isomerase-like protein